MGKLYIVHGWAYSLDTWDSLCELLRQKGIEPIQLKVPGLTQKSDKVWSADSYVEWLRGELKNDPAPVVLGHSNGGRIALWYTGKYPLKHLILEDSAGVPHHKVKASKLSAVKLASKLASPMKYVPLARKVVYHILGAQDYNNAPENMKKTMKNLLASDAMLDLKKVTTPVTLIWGSDDTVTPLSDAKKIKAAIPKVKLHIIDGAMHSPHSTNSEEVSNIIAEIYENI